MKCPKCGYFGPDSLNTCKKCGKELFTEKAKLGLNSLITRSFKPRPIPQKQPAPPGLIPKVPISAYPLQEKTSPLFTNEPPQALTVSPPVEPTRDLEEFEFPDGLTKTPPPLSALPSDEELFLPDEPGQEKIELSMDDAAPHEKDEKKEGDKELLSPDKRETILRMKNLLQDQFPGEAPPGRIQTEPLDDDEIAQILQDINPGHSEPGRTT